MRTALTEAEFIAREQRKIDTRFRRWLNTIAREGFASKEAMETLWINGMIQFSGPTDNCRWNHYYLTAKGESELERLS